MTLDSGGFGKRPVVYALYLNPILFFYLKLRFGLRTKVGCFRAHMLPASWVTLLNTDQLETKAFLNANKRALSALEPVRQASKKQQTMPTESEERFEAYKFKAFARMMCDAFVCALALSKCSNIEASTFFLHVPYLPDDARKVITEELEGHGLAVISSPEILAKCDSALRYLFCLAFTVFFGIASLLRPRIEQCSRSNIFIHSLEPQYSGLDPENGLSMSFLEDFAEDFQKCAILSISDKGTKRRWKSAGYNVVSDWTELLSRSERLGAMISTLRCGWLPPILNFKDISHPIRFQVSKKLATKKRVETFVYTTSVGAAEPIEALGFSVAEARNVMINYSSSLWEGAHWAYMLADEVLVWSKMMADFISNHPQCRGFKVNIAGPIAFCSLPAKAQGADHERFRLRKDKVPAELVVGVFDVTPKAGDIINKVRITTPYTQEYWLTFMTDVLSLAACDEVAEIRIKMKGNHKVGEGLLDYQTEAVQSKLRIIEPENNIYRVIEDCDVCVCMPFTSPFYIAQYLGVPTFFYSPHEAFFGTTQELYEYCVYGQESLRAIIRKIATQSGGNIFDTINTNDDITVAPGQLEAALRGLFSRKAY